ncbi:hypothetical protein Tco_0245372 [Tanacetum coccineum]
MNVDNSSSGTTPIIEKIGKFEDLLTSGQAILVDKDGNPLKKVEFQGEYDSEDEVASDDNDMARSMAYEKVGFGTQSLLEQWRDSYGTSDYDDDPYDDDMYEGQDLSHELQAICDNMDIRKVVEDVGEDEDFKNGSWVSATEYVNANGGIVSGCLGDIKNFLKNGKLDQVVAIVKSCTPNVIGDLTVTLKDPSVKVFHKDTVPESGSGVGRSGMLDEEEIVKLLEEEEMFKLELQVCGNVIDQEDLYKFDEEALNLALEEETRQAQAEQEAECGGALGSSGSLKPSTHPVTAILMYTLGVEVKAAYAIEVEAMGALDLMEDLKVEMEAVGALDLVEVEALGALDLVEGALDLVEVEASDIPKHWNI